MALITVYYIYILITIIVFMCNCRNWKFVRLTLLYYTCLTFFGCLVIYGSHLQMHSHLDQWIKEGLLTRSPFNFDAFLPDKQTILRTNPNYFPWLIATLSFFITFPQAVNRAIQFLPYKSKSPQEIIKNTIDWYNKIVGLLQHVKPALPFVLKSINGFYIVGEWFFILITYSGLFSSGHYSFFRGKMYLVGKVYDLNLMLIGCFFIIFFTGADIYTGKYGLISSSTRSEIKNSLQQIVAFVLKVIIVISCIYLFYYLVFKSYLPRIIQDIFNINFGGIALLITIPVSLVLCWFSFILLSKVSPKILIFMKEITKIIIFPIVKLMEWMGYEVSDKQQF